MTLTYDKTNKALSAAAATALLMLGGVNLLRDISNLIYMLIRGISTMNLITNAASLLYYAFWLVVPVVLLVRKKNVLTALVFLLPIAYTVVIEPVISYVILPMLRSGLSISINTLLSYLLDLVFAAPMVLLFLAIMISCFTKGKVFGEKAGIVLLLLAVLAYLAAVIAPLCTHIVTFVIRQGMNFGVALRRYFVQIIDLTILASSVKYILIALAFWRPNREMLPEEPAPEVTE